MASTTRVETTLAARAIGARTDFSGVAITDLSAEEDRFIQIILSEGVIKPVNGFQVVAGSPATMDVVVGSGNAKEDYLVVPGSVPGQGNYIIRLDDATKTLTLDAADPSAALQQNEQAFDRGGITPAKRTSDKARTALEDNQMLMMSLGFRGTPAILVRDSEGLVQKYNGMPQPAALAEIMGPR